MPVIAVTPLHLKDYEMSIGAGLTNDYAAAVNSVVFTPSTSTSTFRGGKTTAVFTETITDSWTCALGYAQDWETTGSLSRFLMENEGKTLPARFRPKTGIGPSFTADISIVPGAIGGTVAQHATTTVTLGSTRPVLVPAA